MFSPHDRSATPQTTFDGRGGDARPIRPAKHPGYDAFAGGLAAWEIRPMSLMTSNLPAEFTRTNLRPATRRPNPLEQIAMQPINQMQTAVMLRMQDMQNEAARRRMLREARAARTAARPLTTLRRAVGMLLVRAGERVQGMERATAHPAASASAGDLTVAGTNLRIVR